MNCPDCNSSEVIKEDHSFSHPFGIEVIFVYFCEDCGWEETTNSNYYIQEQHIR